MRIRGVVFVALVGIVISNVAVGQSKAPATAPGSSSAQKSPATQKKAAAAVPATRVAANLGQLMRGILYPSSNVIFAAQNQNPDDVKPAADPSTATDPLASSYGKWQAVENSALALAEGANLLMIPGRKCANGRDVPIKNADWPMLVQGLREAGLTVYKAAQTKDQDKIVDAAEVMTTACANCHDKYREKPKLEDRCM
jgi:mono/diheme cytochrome c family protein